MHHRSANKSSSEKPVEIGKRFIVGCVPSFSNNNIGLGTRCLPYFYSLKVKKMYLFDAFENMDGGWVILQMSVNRQSGQ